MPLPALAPLAPIALRLAAYGGAVMLGAALAGRRGPERIDMQSEEALDRVPEGADLRVDRANGRADAEARIARTIRIGRDGPGLSFELAGLGRARIRRAPPAGGAR
jgi:hypothetical protein